MASATIRGHNIWREVVPGLDSIAVQFDPARLTPSEAINLLQQQLQNPQVAAAAPFKPATIPICYDSELAPDGDYIAEKMGLSSAALKIWHASQEFTVTMLGFMPGFAYLQCPESVTAIGRLSKPRQKVAAGSIGIIGNQSCIYSFSSPGGWPIIGRTPARLFDPERPQPALLAANQIVSFRAIGRAEFDHIAQDPSA